MLGNMAGKTARLRGLRKTNTHRQIPQFFAPKRKDRKKCSGQKQYKNKVF